MLHRALLCAIDYGLSALVRRMNRKMKIIICIRNAINKNG
jgi:hypothetical protein